MSMMLDGGDALLAQLLGMGFAIEEIERCQVATLISPNHFTIIGRL
jgi:hypothetical protein